MVFSARTTPHTLHQESLANFDSQVRACFEKAAGFTTTDKQWLQASLSVRTGGPGFQSLAR
eukprot:11630618-Karenia_brevis.AAC.1